MNAVRGLQNYVLTVLFESLDRYPGRLDHLQDAACKCLREVLGAVALTDTEYISTLKAFVESGLLSTVDVHRAWVNRRYAAVNRPLTVLLSALDTLPARFVELLIQIYHGRKELPDEVLLAICLRYGRACPGTIIRALVKIKRARVLQTLVQTGTVNVNKAFGNGWDDRWLQRAMISGSDAGRIAYNALTGGRRKPKYAANAGLIHPGLAPRNYIVQIIIDRPTTVKVFVRRCSLRKLSLVLCALVYHKKYELMNVVISEIIHQQRPVIPCFRTQLLAIAGSDASLNALASGINSLPMVVLSTQHDDNMAWWCPP